MVILSAILHALWNLLAKDCEDKESFMWLMTLTSIFTVSPIFLTLVPNLSLPNELLPYLVISGVAETLYFITLSRAYSLGDLSLVYPIARSSPLYITILAVVFLGEEISLTGFLGILLTVLGVYSLHLRSFNPDDILRPFNEWGKASSYALLTALWTTLYSLTDKIAVSNVNPMVYAFWLEPFIVIILTPTLIQIKGWSSIKSEWDKSKFRVLAAGFLMRGGYILVLLAMSLAQVSYILALRQVSVVMGSIIGVLILNEGYGKIRIISSTIIFLGIYILVALV